MQKVYFKWISRAKFNATVDKDPNTIYFIYNEHVLYKGSHEYGGIQSISYVRDDNEDYILTIVNGDGTQDVLKIASSKRLTRAIEMLEDDLAEHIDTLADETTSAHVKLTDTIDAVTPQDVSDNIATTPQAVVNYVNNYQGKSFLKYPTYIDFPLVGQADVLYLASDTGYLWIYEDTRYKIIGDNWKRIEQITGIVN